MAWRKPPIGRLAYPEFNPKFPNQLRNSGLVLNPRPSSVAADEDRHGHESQNEDEDSDGGPDQTRAIKRFPLIEQRRMAEAESQEQSRPKIPSGPEHAPERNQEQRDHERYPLVILACRRVEDMSAIELPAGE